MKSSKGLLGEVEWWGGRRREKRGDKGKRGGARKEGRRRKQLWHLKQRVWNWSRFAS